MLSTVPVAARASADAGVNTAGDGFVFTAGRQFYQADGQPFFIKGINLGNWLMPEGYMFKFQKAKSPQRIYARIEDILGPADAAAFWTTFRDRYVTREDIFFIAEAGFNTVRVPLHWNLFVRTREDGRVEFDGVGYTLVDRLIAWCREAGLSVILDLHAAPGGQTGVNHDDGPGYPLLFYRRDLQDLTVALWRTLATRYANEPTVLGYELLNEPIAPYHDTAYLNSRLEPFYRRLVAEIRAVDPRHVIFLSGAEWSTRFDVFGPPFAPNVAYAYHKFWSSPTREAIQEYLNFSFRYDVPIMLGESGEAENTWVRAFRELHERNDIGWCFWTYKNLDTAPTVVSIRRPAGWDAVIDVVDDNDGLWGGAEAASASMRATARAALAEYLDAIRLPNARVNAGYLTALGLRLPPTR